MLKVKNRAELDALAGKKSELAQVDPMAGVHQAIAALADQIRQTNAIVAQSLSKPEPMLPPPAPQAQQPKEMIATVQRDEQGRMKTIIIKTKAN